MDDPQTNGVAPASARERIAAELEQEIAALLQRERALELELAEVKTDRKSFEQSLMRLRGEPLIKHPGRRSRSELVRPVQSKVGDEAIAQITATIHEFLERSDSDEFRQVDIRGMLNGRLANSSRMATAFEQLRQDGVIRFARKEGIQKFFRLTEAARREASDA
jgi:hypothetical protein